MIKKLFLFGVFSLFFAADSHAYNYGNSITKWWSARCQAREAKVQAWGESNCAPGFGGYDGSCLFGFRPNCFPGQEMIDAGADPGREVFKGEQGLVRLNQRSKSGVTPVASAPRPAFFDSPEKDLSAIKDGKYQVIEKGKVREVQLTPSQMLQLGIKPAAGQVAVPGGMINPVRPGAEQPVRNYNQNLYE